MFIIHNKWRKVYSFGSFNWRCDVVFSRSIRSLTTLHYPFEELWIFFSKTPIPIPWTFLRSTLDLLFRQQRCILYQIIYEFKSHRRQELAKNLIFLGKSILRIIRQMFQPSRGLEKLLEKTNLEDISENMRLYVWE